MPTIVQFLHPSQEATPLNQGDAGIPWNNNPTHRRKFLISEGKFLNHQEKIVLDRLSFWGEWEPQSDIIPINKSNKNPPNYFNIPYINPSVPQRTHTTDPYVFGEHFKYFVCRQRKNSKILKHLEVKSLILFGSCIGSEFCLDTLFVVSRTKRSYNLTTLNQIFPKVQRGQFYFAGINPLYADTNCNPNIDEDDNCRLQNDEFFTYYEGVNFEERSKYDNLYSFVPCKIYQESNPKSSVFAQPKISLDFIQKAQTMGINSKQCDMAKIRAYWVQITEQVAAQGLLKGTFFKTPEQRGVNGA
jgi:hypothetical protein